jgi:membrane protease YdiL (CAAX protease family)
MDTSAEKLPFKARLAIAAALAFCYWTSFQPSKWVLGHGLRAFGNPAYRGTGILIPHLLLYSTLTAVCCALAWLLLVRAGWLAPPKFALNRRVLAWAVIGGAVSIAITLLAVQLTHLAPIGWVGIDPWNVAGNVFSNFFEEFIFRGFMLAGLTALVGFWPAAVLSSLAFGMEHSQYPLVFRFLIAGLGVFWCWLVRKAQSLWAAYGTHMLLDVIVDAMLG